MTLGMRDNRSEEKCCQKLPFNELCFIGLKMFAIGNTGV